jgi:hypothetical protein
VILIRGSFRLDLSVETVTLEHDSDYAAWRPGITHFWQAEEDCADPPMFGEGSLGR